MVSDRNCDLRFSQFFDNGEIAFFGFCIFRKFAISDFRNFAARLWLGQNSKFGGSLIRAYGGHLGGTQGTEIVMGRGAYHHWLVACEAMEGGAFLHCFWHFVDQPQSRDGDGVGRSFANKCGGRDFVIEYGRWRVRQTYRFVVLWSPAFRAALGRCIRFPAWIMDVCEGPSRFFLVGSQEWHLRGRPLLGGRCVSGFEKTVGRVSPRVAIGGSFWWPVTCSFRFGRR